MDKITIQEFETYLRALMMSKPQQYTSLNTILYNVNNMILKALSHYNIEQYFETQYNNSSIILNPTKDYIKSLGFSNRTYVTFWRSSCQEIIPSFNPLVIKVSKTKQKLNGKVLNNKMFFYKDFSIPLSDKSLTFEQFIIKNAQNIEENLKALDENVEKLRTKKLNEDIEAYKEFAIKELQPLGLTFADFLELRSSYAELPYNIQFNEIVQALSKANL